MSPRSKKPTCGSCRFRVKFEGGLQMCSYGYGFVNRTFGACAKYLPAYRKIEVVPLSKMMSSTKLEMERQRSKDSEARTR